MLFTTLRHMGVIARQATSNAITIILATIVGAVNTVFVLPQVFNETPDDWGMIKLITAYGLTGAQFLSFGAPRIINRFFPGLKGNSRAAMVSFALMLPIGLALLSGLLAVCIHLCGIQNPLFSWGGQNEILCVFTIMLFQALFISLYGYAASIHKTTLFQFLNDLFQKLAYLLLVIAYGVEWLNFYELLYCYTGIFALQFLVLLAQCIQNELRFNFRFKALPLKQYLEYGAFSILDRGASVVAANLDIMMLGFLLGAAHLEDIAFYTIAFYMGSVAMIPQKSISVIAHPIVAAAIHNKSWNELRIIYEKTSVSQLLMGGFIFIAIWINIDEILLILPEKFRGGKWVVLFIGLSKLIHLASGVSGAIIVFSRFFRSNLVINLVLLALTALTNYFFISEKWLDYGINGAASATALTYLCFNAIKMGFVYNKFGISPFNKEFATTSFLILGVASLYWFTLLENAWISIIVKTMLAACTFALVAYKFNLSEELNKMARKIIPGLK